eukprot:scaffold181605_cov33-Tisochrysis_lutea.AAC.2
MSGGELLWSFATCGESDDHSRRSSARGSGPFSCSDSWPSSAWLRRALARGDHPSGILAGDGLVGPANLGSGVLTERSSSAVLLLAGDAVSAASIRLASVGTDSISLVHPTARRRRPNSDRLTGAARPDRQVTHRYKLKTEGRNARARAEGMGPISVEIDRVKRSE